MGSDLAFSGDTRCFDMDDWLSFLRSAADNPVPIADMWAQTQTTAVELLLPGLGALSAHPALLPKLRGGLGMRLMTSACNTASYAFRQKLACHCKPSCASWLLFGTHPVSRPNAPGETLAKPFALAAGARKRDLKIRLTLFGHASALVGQVRNALSAACLHDLPWRALCKDVGYVLLPDQPSLARMHVAALQLQAASSFRQGALLTFSGGLEVNERSNAVTPSDIFDWTISRFRGLAPWYGAALDETEVPLLKEEWLKAVTSFSLDAVPLLVRHRSSRSGETWESMPQRSSVELDAGLSRRLCDMLVLGEMTHVGRGAVNGLGRYKLSNLL